MENAEKNSRRIPARVLDKLPSPARRAAGPYALFECFQSIPCNPCFTFCRFGAVKPLDNINDIPELDYDKCTGCMSCVPNCPGLAIFMIDETYAPDQSLVTIPYEYLPLPEKGAEVDAVDREGALVCKATVANVRTFRNSTAAVSLAVPKACTHAVRGMALAIARGNGAFQQPAAAQALGDSIVCRCEDITMEELQALLAANKLTLAEIKLDSRMSMGLCQGTTCIPQVLQAIAQRTGKPINDLPAPRKKQPVKPVAMASLAGIEPENK